MAETSVGGGDARFHSTLWTTILRARDGGGDEKRAAMGRLIERYWKPLYVVARRRDCDVETAKDVVQGFFERALEKDYLKDVAPDRGRFRSWLLAALGHFLSDQRERERALKRGGGKVLAIDVQDAEETLAASTEPPERLFARAWATELLDRSIARLRAEWKDRPSHFDLLAGHLKGAGATNRQTADQLGLAEHDVKNQLTKMRGRLREIIREEVADSVDDPREVDGEIAELFDALS